jgi:hypothetical protein
MASVHIDTDCNEVVAHLPGVRAELAATAEGGKARAEAILAGHHRTGQTEITVTAGDKLDYFVNLVDNSAKPAAAAIEYGHTTKGGRAVRGVHAISGAF